MRTIIPAFSLKTLFFAALAALLFAYPSAFGKPDLTELADHGNARLAIYASATPAFADNPIGAEAKRAAKRGGDTLKIIKENKIANPVRIIAANLATHMAEEHGFQVVSLKLISWRGEDRETRLKDRLVEVGESADYILSVTNVAWFTLSKPGNLQDYLVGYSLELELIDVQSGKAIVKSNRDFTSNSAHPFESRGEEGAKVFKATLNELTEDAIKHYTKRVLK